MAELFRFKVSEKQTIDLPARLSSRLGLKPGDELEFLIGDDNSLAVTTIPGAGRSEPAAEVIQELERRTNRDSAPKKLLEAALRKSALKVEAIASKLTGSAS